MEWSCKCGAVNRDGEGFCGACGAPKTLPAAGLSHQRPSSKKKVILIVSALVAVVLLGLCVIGIVAAIAIPSFIVGRADRKEREKQAQAMQKIREFAERVHKHRATHGHYPNWENRDKGFHLYSMEEASAFMFKERNEGVTIDWGPILLDPWNNSYQYGVNGASNEFVIICKGSDGKTTMERLPDEHVGTHCFEDDIIWLNDGFIQEPEGKQKKCR